MNVVSRWLESWLSAMPRNQAAARALTSLRSDLWLHDPEAFDALLLRLRAGAESMTADDIRAAIEAGNAAAPMDYARDGATAIVPIQGEIMKEAPCLLSWFGEKATSTVDARALLEQLAADETVDSIMLNIDSPGGSVDGLELLASAVREASASKPVHAHANDLAASAAYWIASQADRFTIGPTAAAGSIGVFTAIDDVSKAFSEAGVKRNVVQFGEHKAIGLKGTEVTDKQLSEVQKRIDAIGNLFVDAIASGRGMSRADALKLATGSVWTGEQAVEVGIADGVESAAEALANLRAATPPKRAVARAPQKESAMDLSQIYAKLSRGEKLSVAELAFLREQTGEPAATPIEARADVPDDVRAEIARERKEREELAAEVAKLKSERVKAAYLEEAKAFKYVPGLSTEQIAAHLQAADEKLSQEEAAQLRVSFKSTNEIVRSSKAFEAFGSTQSGDDSPMGQLKAIAKQLQKANPKLTDLVALAEAGELRPDLYNAAQAEG